VTEVLNPWADFSKVRPEVLENAARRGTDVHAACLCKVQGLWMPAVPEDCAGYVASFMSWAGPMIEEVVAAEIELRDEHDLRVVGHPDIICRLRGDRVLTMLDLKTPAAVSRSWPLQLAGYHRLGRNAGYDIGRAMTLRLKKDGGRPIVDEPGAHNLALNLMLFRSARALWSHFNE
jgi:hypothetical protein